MKEVRRSDLRCFFLANFCDDDGGDDGDDDGDGGDDGDDGGDGGDVS